MDLDPRARRVPAVAPVAPALGEQSYQQPNVGQTAARFSLRRWGIPVRPVISRPTASTTAGDVLGGDAKRVFWMIVNRGTTDVSLDLEAAATAGNGILLAAGGGYASMDVTEDAEAVTYRVSAIAASGTPQLWVYQVLAV